MKKKPEPIVETKPCGCSTTTYANSDRKVFAPCVPCGLREVAQMLVQAGKALGAVSAFISKNAANATMADAVTKATEKS